MSPSEIQAFVVASVRKLRHEDGFLHCGKDAEVYIYIYITGILLTYELQGNDAWFNHPAYLQILEEFAYGPNSIANKFPHKFHPLYPIPSMALVADIVSTIIFSVPPKLTFMPVSCCI
jgi:hypothetical protein